jgi:hypothetical protein
MKIQYIMMVCLLGIGIHFSFVPTYNENNAFQGGEKLTYKMFYNWNFVWLSAGEMNFEVKDEGSQYHLEVTGRTYSSYEWFYKVRDHYHSYIDKETGLPNLYIRDIHQGTYDHYERIEFDRINNKAISYTGRSATEVTSRTIYDIEGVYDLVSAMYYLRNTDLRELKNMGNKKFTILLDSKKYNLSLNYKGNMKSESVKENGNFKTVNATADLITGSAFNDGAQLKLSISDDLNKLPLLLESPLNVGSVKAILKQSKNLKYPLDSKIK